MSIGDILFEIFWIITGLTANVIALVLSFFIFAVIFNWLRGNNKEG